MAALVFAAYLLISQLADIGFEHDRRRAARGRSRVGASSR